MLVHDGPQFTPQRFLARNGLVDRTSAYHFLVILERESIALFDDAPAQPREIGQHPDACVIGQCALAEVSRGSAPVDLTFKRGHHVVLAARALGACKRRGKCVESLGGFPLEWRV